MKTIECEEFYDLCQAYRHAPDVPQDQVIAAYKALIEYIDKHCASEEGSGNMSKTQALKQVEFQEEDFPVAKRMARRLGYTQTAYTSSSALWGLFCLPDRATTLPHRRGGCIIKTRELGFLWVQDQEDIVEVSK